jgi:type I restriction enzyme S subunit
LTIAFEELASLTDKWRRVPISTVCTFIGGCAFPRERQGRATGKYPFFKVSDMNAAVNTREMRTASNYVDDEDVRALRGKVAPAGTVVFPKVGAALKTEKRRVLAAPGLFDNNILGLVPGSDVLSDYLLAVMETVRLGAMAQEGVVPSVNQTQIGSIEIPVPSVDEQTRIVDVLGAIEAQIFASDEEASSAAALLTALRASLSDSGEHTLRPLGDFLEKIEGGKSLASLERVPADGERAVLKVSAVRPALFVETEAKALSTDAPMPERARVSQGDVLITRANTAELVGAVCRVERPVGALYLSDKTLRLVFREDIAHPQYFVHALSAPAVRRQLAAAATGTSGSMKNISQAKIASLLVEVPDVTTQQALAALFESALDVSRRAAARSSELRRLKVAVRDALLSGRHAIPDSYDRFLTDENTDDANLEPATV